VLRRCFVTLLEAVKDVNKSIPITYASSSSVYGLNTEVPFSEKHRIDRQASLYGATKQSNERIAHVYHHLHGLRLTGLRFFTVYGPLGRPDMAYFSFTQAILEGKTITEYRNPDGTELKRDFTYVSDIVSGILAASRLAAPLEVFNLGNTQPEPVSRLISLLEAGLGRQANVKQEPISAGDVPMTYADVSHAASLLKYKPQVRARGGWGERLGGYDTGGGGGE
jgi:UDP-glucuronate 4-epimerase